MKPTPLSATLAAQADRLTALATEVAAQGHAKLAVALTIHAAQLACHETTARQDEAEMQATRCALDACRSALRRAKSTPTDPAQRDRFDAVIRRMLPTPPGPQEATA